MKKKLKTLKLGPIDLSTYGDKTQGEEPYNTNPNIKVGHKYQYLALVDGRFAAGSFTKQWYGLNFEGFYDSGLQYDTPGHNASDWQGLWLIVK